MYEKELPPELSRLWAVGRWVLLGAIVVFLIGTMTVVFNTWMDRTLVGVSAADAGATTSSPDGVTRAAPGQKVNVVIQGLNLRTQASQGAGVIIRKLPKGMSLVLLGRKPGWFNVKTSDGTVGWVVDRQGYSSLVP